LQPAKHCHELQDSPREANELWVATQILLGLRYATDVAGRYLQGARKMRESVTYQAILAEGREEGREEGLELGRLEGERRLLLRIGERRFGRPDARTKRALARITYRERLERLGERIFEATTWQDLLASP
jgi:predicted transposase YdaD